MGSRLSMLKSQLNSLLNKKSKYEKRVEKLRKVKGNLESGLDDEVSSVNKHDSSALEHFNYGLKGASSLGNVASGYNELKQQSPTSDGYLQSCCDNINNEISRCEIEIDKLSTAIRIKRQEIASAKDDD